MRAVRVLGHGGVDRLVYGEVSTPKPARGEVLVHVRATALNHADLWMRRGAYAPRGELGGWRGKIEFPRIPGQDIAGVRADNGTRVIVYPSIPCGTCRHCQIGDTLLCPCTEYIGSERDGGYAEAIAVPEANLLPIPAGVPDEVAAAFTITYLTAWHMVVARGGLSRGEMILVSSAASGVGVAVLQIARFLGARSIALVGSTAKAERVLELGADYAVTREASDWSNRVRELTDGRGVEMVADVVGTATFEGCLGVLQPEGRLVTCGATSGPYVDLDLRQLYLRHLSIIGSTLGTRDELEYLLTLLERKVLWPVVDRVYPLADAAAAQVALEQAKHVGKLVLDVGLAS